MTNWIAKCYLALQEVIFIVAVGVSGILCSFLFHLWGHDEILGLIVGLILGFIFNVLIFGPLAVLLDIAANIREQVALQRKLVEALEERVREPV